MKPEQGAQKPDRYREIASTLTHIGRGWLLADPPRPGPSNKHAPLLGPTELRATLEGLGPTFIRLGQFLSTRPGPLPPEYVAELSGLEDPAAAVPHALIVAVIESELGARLEKIFASFERVPLATASIGQVHGAQLLLGREEVVVKVQRPLVAAEIEYDLAVLQELAEEAEYHTPLGSGHDPKRLVDEFAHSLRCELNYVREGKNIERLGAELDNEPGLRIPRVHWNYTARRVIVLERPRAPDGPARPRWLPRAALGSWWRPRLARTFPVALSMPMWPHYGLPRSGQL